MTYSRLIKTACSFAVFATVNAHAAPDSAKGLNLDVSEQSESTGPTAEQERARIEARDHASSELDEMDNMTPAELARALRPSEFPKISDEDSEEIVKVNDGGVLIDINKRTQVMRVTSAELKARWPVSTARKGYETPSGNFQPYYLAKMHLSKKYDLSPMPHSIFYKDGWAIHATDSISKLGRPASHGCVRLHPDHAAQLYAVVSRYNKSNVFINIH